MGETVVEILVALLIFGVPTAALTIRFVLRPMLREVVEAVRATKGQISPELERRLSEMEEGQQLLIQKLDRLLEAERFRQQLESGQPKEGDR
jgi:hypothetical protein